jgi:hypothetical protein
MTEPTNERSTYKCLNCQDQRWVCENHPHVSWNPDNGGADCCGGAGMPCELCNPCTRDEPPAFPPGMTVIETFGH